MLLALIALPILTLPALAQDQGADPVGFDAHGFQLAPLDADVRDPLTLQRPGKMRPRAWFAGAVLEFADEPLVATRPNGDEVPVVDDLFALNVSLGTVLHERVRVEGSTPVYFAATGPDGPRGAGIGDARLGGMVLLLVPGAGDDGFGLGVSPYVDLPTGNDSEFLGQSNLSGGAIVSASGALADLTMTMNAGAQINPSVDRANLTGSDMVTLGLGAGYRASQTLGVNYEIRGAMPLEASSAAGTGTPFEGLLTGRYVDGSGGFVVGGAAMGLTPGIGVANFRVLLGGGFGTGNPGAFDTDGDGIVDAEDECPDTAGTADLAGCGANVELTVTTTLDGRVVAGAQVRIEGPVVHEAVSTATALRFDVPPDSMWRGAASLGDCLAGDSITPIRDEDEKMEVKLEYDPKARLRLAILDVNGSTVAGVRVRFESADPYCEVREIPPLDADGQVALDIGVGAHKVIVDAPGYSVYEEAFKIEERDEREIFVLLSP